MLGDKLKDQDIDLKKVDTGFEGKELVEDRYWEKPNSEENED